jgi:hypothetical protein
VESEPAGPRPTDVRRQHQVVEDLLELCDVDVEADVVLGALPEYLFIDAEPVGQEL